MHALTGGVDRNRVIGNLQLIAIQRPARRKGMGLKVEHPQSAERLDMLQGDDQTPEGLLEMQ